MIREARFSPFNIKFLSLLKTSDVPHISRHVKVMAEEDDLEGYPTALAVGSAESIPDEFICPVCMNIVRDPVETKCNHIFCKSCLTAAVSRMPGE